MKVVAIDVSGSITDEEQNVYQSLLDGIAINNDVHLILFDHEVVLSEKFDSHVTSRHLGLGGTLLTPVVEEVEKLGYDNVTFISDGGFFDSLNNTKLDVTFINIDIRNC